jgi:arsenite-transporting ATPase
LGELVDQLVQDCANEEKPKDLHGLVMVMGKGGVGKTTIAAAVALELARRGHRVHLSTTDPAAHLTATLDMEFADSQPALNREVMQNLKLSRIDPVAETASYKAKILASKGRNLDEEGKSLLLEDLASPCTEEVAVFHAFSRIVSEARSGIVVLDTAPTGHTLLLLDATGAYHREVARAFTPTQIESGRVITPLLRLRDASYTKILLVTLPEPTPVSEAGQLQADLRRAQIEPWAWVVNSSLAKAAELQRKATVTDPVLVSRIRSELVQLDRVRKDMSSKRLAVVPWKAVEPSGIAQLLSLAEKQ